MMKPTIVKKQNKTRNHCSVCLYVCLSDRASITFYGDPREAQWPSVCAPSPTKHDKLTSPCSGCETLYPIPLPTQPLYFERTGDNSLKGQEIAPLSLMYSDWFTCKQQTACLSLLQADTHPPNCQHYAGSVKHKKHLHV